MGSVAPAGFPYYLETYGFHSIHGRAPTIATGLALARPDLSVWVVTGDGDALSIGGNHLIHALRRNVNITILLFNNRIYGLTKGQYSPTSEVGKVTKSTPMGSLDQPFNPVSVALGAEATFVGRALDSDRKGLSEVLRAAAAHRGAALVEILQDCPIFNDGSFDALRKEGAEDRVITVRHGEPITFGADGEYCVVQSGFGLEVAKTADVAAEQIVVHDAHADNPAYAFALSRLSDQNLEHTVMGIFRQVNRPAYDDAAREQIDAARGRPRRTTGRPCSRCCAVATPGPSTNRDRVGCARGRGAGRRRVPADGPRQGHHGAPSPSPDDHGGAHRLGAQRPLFTRSSWSRPPGRCCLTCARRRQILRDDVRGIGPLLATGRGLRAAAAAGADRAFVSAVDMPNLSVDLIDVLARYRDVDVVLPWDGRDHYLAGVYRTALADVIDDLIASGERRMRALADSVRDPACRSGRRRMRW